MKITKFIILTMALLTALHVHTQEVKAQEANAIEKYDLCVIGAGPAGYAATMRAIDFGKKVLLVEKGKVGGAGIHNGALTSKTWRELSKQADEIFKQAKILNIAIPTFNFKALKAEVDLAVKEREELLYHNMDNINLRLKGDLFFFKRGVARLIEVTPTRRVEITTQKGKEVIEASHVILATGSRPRNVSNIEVDDKVILTSDSIESLTAFPKSIVIVGAGVIGCEYATIFANFKETKVFLIDKGERILPFEDEDVVKVIESDLETRGVVIHRNATLKELKKEGDEVVYTLEYKGGKKETFRVEKALLSIGRVPNVEGIVSQELGLKLKSGAVDAPTTETNLEGVYAIGDLTADTALVNVGELEGRFAVESIFSTPKRPLVYENISMVMFFPTEVAGIGLNETDAKAKGLNYKVATVDYKCLARATSMRNTIGFIKIIVTDDDEMKVLGARIIGREASSAIEGLALLIYMNHGIAALAEMIHPHPAITEGVQECARIFQGTSILKPQVLPEHMSAKRYKNGRYENL